MSLFAQRHVVLGSIVTTTPPTPVLPSHTIRCKFSSGYTPTMGDTQTLVDAQENIWDIYKASNDWNSLFDSITDLLEVVEANLAGVTDMSRMFFGCRDLASISRLSNTSSVTDMSSMCSYCIYLVAIPQTLDTSSVTSMSHAFTGCIQLAAIPQTLDTSSVQYMDNTFYNCTRVESGALALYQQASQQTTPPINYDMCFTNCGLNTPVSAPIHAEMQQIPTSWGGNGA